MAFNDEYNPDQISGNDHESGFKDENTSNMENKYNEVSAKSKEKIGNFAKTKGKNYVKNKLGLNNNIAKDKAASIAKASGKKITNAISGMAKTALKKASSLALKAGAKIGASALGVLGPFGLFVLGAVIVVGVVAMFTGIITDEEYSRTNQANYQHKDYKDGNTLKSNYANSSGNVFFNKDTKRYELAKGEKPTEANKLYYVYYAIMANQSRWFVEYERTNTKPGDDKAGTKENPYFKPIKRKDEYQKYTFITYRSHRKT